MATATSDLHHLPKTAPFLGGYAKTPIMLVTIEEE
jgi:hypothetical protein